MKITKKIRSLVICMLALGVVIQQKIVAQNDPMAETSQQDPSEQTLLRAFNQLQQVDTLITQLALLVTNGFIKNLNNPKEIIHILREMRTIINGFSGEQAAIIAMKNPEINQQLTAGLTDFCDEIILHLEKGLHNNLKGFKKFNIENLAKRGRKQTPTHSLIKQSLQKIDKKIESLKHSVDNTGLTWYNKLARTTDKWIVTPASNYHIPTIVYYTAGISLISTYALWLYGKDFQKHLLTPQFIKDAITTLYSNNGEPLLRDQYQQIKDDESNHEHHPLAVAELSIRQTLGNQNPLITLAGGALIHSFYEETWKRQIEPALTKKRDAVWNYLRGGSFLQQSEQGGFFTEPEYNFDDMVGLDEVKEQFSTIIQYLENPEHFANMNASPAKGWLLTGPKRTGKSFSFKCLCGEIVRMQEKQGKKNIFKFMELEASFIHEHGIKSILSMAKAKGPMILFIDEIDLLNLSRVGDTKLLNEFLTAMQSSMDQDPSKVVIIIAATNKPQTLDPALRANGRLGKEIRFEYPAKKYRIEFIKKELTKMALDIRQFDIERLAEKTDQKSFEDLSAVIVNAMTRAWNFGQQLTQQFLEESIDTEMHHVIMTDRKNLPERENNILASHFAGRALATLLLTMNTQLDKVTIHARMTDLAEESQWSELYKDKEDKDKDKKIEHGHITTRLLNDSIHLKSEEFIRNEAKSLIAGFIAEELLLGSCGFTCHAKEHEHAYKLLERLVFEGLNPQLVAKDISNQLKQKAYNLLQQCKAEVKQLLIDHQSALKAIADELMAKRILTDKEVQAIIDKAEGKIVAEETTAQVTETQAETTDADTDAKTAEELIAAPAEEAYYNS